MEIPADVYCARCAYCLHRAVGEVCPECGHAIGHLRGAVSGISWERRRERGRIRGYWGTVWMVTFRNRRFCDEFARPLRYADARRFQLVTVLHVWLFVILAALLAYLSHDAGPEASSDVKSIWSSNLFPPSEPTLVERVLTKVWLLIVVTASLLVFVAAATGAPSYFFHPRAITVARQNTAIVMSYYACGPLALTPLLLIPLLAIGEGWLREVTQFEWNGWQLLYAVATVSSFNTPVWLWWANLVRIARRTMPQLRGRWVLVAVGTPLLWAVLAGIIVVGIPFVVLAVLVVFASLS